MNKPQEIIELSGWQFSSFVLLGGVFSPLVLFISWILEVLKKWL